MYTQIVVLSYQSPDADSFTYEIPKNLEGKIKIGQLVSVPFGKRNPLGIVVKITDKKPETNYQLKNVSSIIFEQPLLHPYQVQLAIWISDYYIAPLVNCLKTILPEIPKRITSYPQPIIRNPQSTQTIVLVPTINHLPEIMSQFHNAKNHILFTNELKNSEKFTAWQKILSGQSDFIFGSRSAIFTPCPNLKKIIIFNEHENAYKDDRSPYFDTLSVAEKISELTGAKIEIVDPSPKITTYFNHSKEVTIPRLSFSLQTKIISLENERKAGNYSPISFTLEQIIKRAAAKNLSILLFLNKKIESGSIYCKNCKHQEFFKSQPELCPNCQSPEIFFNSTNINSLAKDLKKILPAFKITILAEGITKPFVTGNQPAITIATSSVFYKLMATKYDLVAHIFADSPLNFNEYNSTEDIYSQITNLKKLTSKLLVIQAFNQDLPAIKFAINNNYLNFYNSEIGPRRILKYPPYSLLVKIAVKAKTEIQTESNTQKIFERLKQSTTVNQPSAITLLGPYKALSKTAISYNITLKIPVNSYSLKSKELALKKISPLIPKEKGVKIIVEPKNLNQ